MSKSRVVVSSAVLAVLAIMVLPLAGSRLDAQNRKNYSIQADDTGHAALGLAIRKLGVAGTYLQAPAHPDDETNALFALYGYGQGFRVIDVQNNRGEGGQNEIGPELFRDIGVLRTSELLAAHKLDGAEQYFTRAIDYGYSFSPEEVIQKWGREGIVGDYVRFLRTFRPDVMLTMNIQGGGGDRAHEATTILAREGYLAAGDPTKYPEQIAAGLRPWQPYKLYFAGAGGGRGAGAPPAPAHACRVDSNVYDPLLARTYGDISADARSNHKCQGMGGVPALPGFAAAGRGGGGRGAAPAGAPPAAGAQGAATPAGGRAGAGAGAPPAGGGFPGGGTYTLMATTPSMAAQKDKDETSFFDGIDVSIQGLAKYAGGNPPAALTGALANIADQASQAKQAFDYGNDARSAAPIEAGLTAIRKLRAGLGAMGLNDNAKYEIDFRLGVKERDYENAVMLAHGVSLVAAADDGLVVAGQPIRLQIAASNRGATDVDVTNVKVTGVAGATACVPGAAKKDGVYTCTSTGTIPADAKLTEPYFQDNYWKSPKNLAQYAINPDVPFGVPFAPTPFRVAVTVHAGSVDVTRDVPVEYRYVKDIYFGDKRMELNVVPAYSVSVTPQLAIMPMATRTARAPEREVFVSVVNGAKGAAEATVTLKAPAGWTVTPATAPIAFEKEDEALSARFVVRPAATAKSGDYKLTAVVASKDGSASSTSGYQEIDYPHIQRRQVIKPAEVAVKVLDLRVAPGLKVGYINGVGDQVPPAIEQLGAKLTFIDTNELAWGDLSKYDLIMTGVRAYERRNDLRAYNRRLLDYVSNGGTVIVQYNKNEFNQAQYGPYPAQIGGSGVSGRVNDENVPVKLLAPTHPVFNFPNEIGAAEWMNWTQERGQYFLGKKDPKYVDLVTMTDSFPDNPGEQLGGLVEAKYGKGRWMYLGLGLWRQLPAGTTGAYELLANLLSLPKAPVK